MRRSDCPHGSITPETLDRCAACEADAGLSAQWVDVQCFECEHVMQVATPPPVWAEVHAERVRAHKKHGESSMESLPVTDMTRLSVLVEEVGEVAREFNEARHRVADGLLPQSARERCLDLDALRKELIQVAAMAGAWADALPQPVMPARNDATR